MTQNWPSWPNIGVYGLFEPMLYEKSMQTRCPGGFPLCGYQKLLLPPVKFRIFGPKTDISAPKYAFFDTYPAASFGVLLVSWLVGGCGARAVSRKTPVYFIVLCLIPGKSEINENMIE